MADTRINLAGLELDNPVIPASGTFGFGHEFAELYDLNILGSIAVKGTTQEARFGNLTPRIAECTAGMINSVGLQNPGIEHVLTHELPELAKVFRKKIILNIGGFSTDEFAFCCSLADGAEQVGIIELNISCPNLHCGGMNFGASAQSAAEAVNATAATGGQFSLEERMGCGFGACMGCSCKTLTGSKRICKDGPVLEKGEILWPTRA